MEAILTARQMRRLRRRVIARKRNEPPVLTAGEEVFNAVSHGLGAVLAAVAAVLLLVRSDTGLKVMASCFYGVSMFLMMLMSSVYHAMPTGSTAKRVCRRFDYTSIYLLIGGTFAPILLVYVGGKLGVTLAATAFHAVFPHRLERAHVPPVLLSKRTGAAVVHPDGRHGVYPGDDPLCTEPEI